MPQQPNKRLFRVTMNAYGTKALEDILVHELRTSDTFRCGRKPIWQPPITVHGDAVTTCLRCLAARGVP